MTKTLIVYGKVKEIAKEEGIENMSPKTVKALEEKVTIMIKDACIRAKKNFRSTVMEKDV